MKGFLSEPLERRQSVTNTTTCNRHNVEWMVALDQLPCALWTVADHTVRGVRNTSGSDFAVGGDFTRA